MNYLINPLWFYGINILSHLSIMLIVALVALGIALVIFTIYYFCEMECASTVREVELNKQAKAIYKKLTVAIIASALAITFIPSEETCYKMFVASMVTEQSYEFVKGELGSVVDTINDSAINIIDAIQNKTEGESN